MAISNSNDRTRPGQLVRPSEAGLSVDADLAALCPRASEDEQKQLEANILADGCRDPIVAWNGTIVDGHNRFRICSLHDIAFRVEEKQFADVDAARKWVIENQLGRRNLSPSDAADLRGKLYNVIKRQDGGHGDQRSGGQNVTPKNAAQEVARKTGVSSRQVKRDAAYASALDTLIPEVQEGIRSGKLTCPRADVLILAKLSKDEQHAAMDRAIRETSGKIVVASRKSKPDEMVDALGQPVPTKFESVFDSRSKFQNLRNLFNAIKREVIALADQPGGSYIHAQSVITDLNNAKSGVLFNEPFTICPYCKAKKKDCDGCKGRGWCHKRMHDVAPRELK